MIVKDRSESPAQGEKNHPVKDFLSSFSSFCPPSFIENLSLRIKNGLREDEEAYSLVWTLVPFESINRLVSVKGSVRIEE